MILKSLLGSRETCWCSLSHTAFCLPEHRVSFDVSCYRKQRIDAPSWPNKRILLWARVYVIPSQHGCHHRQPAALPQREQQQQLSNRTLRRRVPSLSRSLSRSLFCGILGLSGWMSPPPPSHRSHHHYIIYSHTGEQETKASFEIFYLDPELRPCGSTWKGRRGRIIYFF